jgi:hypothetical protein
MRNSEIDPLPISPHRKAPRRVPFRYGWGFREALRRLLISQHQSAGIGLLVIFQQDLSQGKVVRV